MRDTGESELQLMTLPNLLHPVPIVIEQLDQTNTVYDEDYREPVMQASHATSKTLPGQVKWGLDDELAMSVGGPSEKADGYVLFRYVDLNAQSVTLKQNDRFTKIGNVETDVYIVSLKPIGHYPDAGGATMVKAFFSDRQPSRQGLQ